MPLWSSRFCWPRPALLFFVFCLALAPLGNAQSSISLPQAQVGTAYDIAVVAQGGSLPLTWHVSGGALPPGLQLSTTGEIQGTPTAAQQDPYTFTVSVSDSSKPAQTAAMQFSLVVLVAPLRITGIAQKGPALKIVGVSSGENAPDPAQNAAPAPAAPATPVPGSPAPAASAAGTAIQSTTNPPATPQNPCSTLKSLPGILGTLVNGQTSFSGCLESGASAAQISVIDAGKTVQCSSTNPQDFVQQPLLFPAVEGAGGAFAEFAAQLPNALKTGQQVCLTEIGASGKTMANSAVVTAPPTAATPDCLSTSSAYFPAPPLVGYRVVSGCAGKAAVAHVLVYEKSSNTNSCPAAYPPQAKPAEDVAANVDPKTGIFGAKLTNALSEGQLICAYAIPADQHPPVVAAEWSYGDPGVPIGRTHYYLSTGVQLSENNQQFSNQNLYLGFSLDRNWLRGSPTRSFTGLFNSEFSAQLTAIPVAASSTTSTTTAGSTTTPSSTTTTTSLSTFISSRKAAVVSGDVYAPLYTNAFKGWFGTQTTAFFGPIVQGGLQTTTSGALSVSAPAPGTATTTATVNQMGLYYFWGAGLRLGDLRLHRSWNVAPEVLSHLDLTVGQWENFKQCRTTTTSSCTPGASGTVPASQLYQPLLFSVEGQLDVPKTPVLIGFQSVTPLHGGGQGDLRFFFGVKLDVGCLYKTFKGGSTPSFFQCSEDQSAENPTTAATTASGSPAAGPKPASESTTR